MKTVTVRNVLTPNDLLTLKKVTEKLIGYLIWFENERDEAQHDCGNPDSGNPLDCEKCQWASSAKDMNEIIENLNNVVEYTRKLSMEDVI